MGQMKIWPILEARAEIQKYFRSFFGSNEGIQKSSWNYLTFKSKEHDKIIVAAADISNLGEESKSNLQFYAMTALASALVGVAIGKKVWGKIVQ